MKQLLVTTTVSIVVFLQVCHPATIKESRSKLNQLRTTAKQYLDAAFSNYTKMSNEVDAVSFWSKQYGLSEIQKKSVKFLSKLKAEKAKMRKCRDSRENAVKHLEKINSDELIVCLESQVNETVDAIFKIKSALGEYVMKAIYEEEKSIISCHSDESCLERVVANLNDKISSLADVIEDEIVISGYAAEVQLDYIKDCAHQSISNAQLSLNTISSCLY